MESEPSHFEDEDSALDDVDDWGPAEDWADWVAWANEPERQAAR